MTIDEYFYQLKSAIIKMAQLDVKLKIEEARVMGTGSGLSLNGGLHKYAENMTEIKRANYIDIINEYKEVFGLYKRTKATLEDAINDMLYLEGYLIQHIYIYNVIFNEAGLNGVEDLLNTENRIIIKSKLAEAKKHLADILRAKGIEIE